MAKTPTAIRKWIIMMDGKIAGLDTTPHLVNTLYCHPTRESARKAMREYRKSIPGNKWTVVPVTICY